MQRFSAQCLAVLFKGMLEIVAYEIVVNNGAVGTYEHISRNSVESEKLAHSPIVARRKIMALFLGEVLGHV